MKTRHPKAIARDAAREAARTYTYIKHWSTDDTNWDVRDLVSAIGDALECGDSVRENQPADSACNAHWVMLVRHGHITALGRRRLREAVFARLGLSEGRGDFILAALAASDHECSPEEWEGLKDLLEGTLSTACRDLNP